MRICQQCGTVYYGAEVFCNKDGTRLDGTSPLTVETQATPIDPLVGKTLQRRYRVMRKLGEGGMGVVYMALHVDIEKKVAIKVLRDDFSKRPEVVERFRQEARAASRIGHANIVDVTDFGQLEDGGVYFAMEYLQGKPLADEVRGKTLPLLRAVPIVHQIARALSAAHRLGIVHRDLKPENIFLVEKDEQHDFVKILDFGIAKISDQDSEGKRLTQTGMIFGTPEYMSPEQASGKALDHRVDVYALGCIMFEMFTGQVPYSGDSFMAVLTQHMFEPVPRIEEVNPGTDLPHSVKQVVYRAMSKDIKERYSDMTSLEEDLERALRDDNYVVESSEPHSGLIRVTQARKTGDESSRRFEVVQTKMEVAGSSPIYLEKRLSKKQIRMVIIGGVCAVGLAGLGILYGAGVIGKEGDIHKTKSLLLEETLKVDKVDSLKKGETETSSQDKEERIENPLPILVKIETEPSGAIVEVEGKGQVCGSSPCEVSLKKDVASEISARLNKKTGHIVFTASQQNNQVRIVLEEPPDEDRESRVRSKRREKRIKKESDKIDRTGSETPTESGLKTGAKSADGLKIPDVFKE